MNGTLQTTVLWQLHSFALGAGLLYCFGLTVASSNAQDCLALPNVPLIYVDRSYSGPNPNGTPSAPFRTVVDAYNAAVDCNIIKISSGNYSEALTMSKHIQLQGQGGPVTIGALSGTFYGNANAVYYIQRSGNDLWWAGESVDAGKTPLQVWHRGLDYSTVFHGTIVGNTVTGEWVDVCRGTSVATGTLAALISTTVDASGTIRHRLVLTGGSYHTTELTEGSPVNDFLYQYPDGHVRSLDLCQRFREVHKNDNPWFNTQPYPETALGDIQCPENLRPYRDQTVFYGEITTRNATDDQPPHVNYPILTRPTDFRSFVCLDPGDGDGDLDFRLHIFVNQFAGDFPSLPTDFPGMVGGSGLGWTTVNEICPGPLGDNGGNGPHDVLQKLLNLTSFGLFDPGAAAALGLPMPGNRAYLGIEGIMHGRDAGKTGDQINTDCGTMTVNRLFPGWADTDGNSILINGRPINGVLTTLGDAVPDSPGHSQVGLQTLLGHRLQYDTLRPTEVRVTGALILDCGHSELGADDPSYTAPSGSRHSAHENAGWDQDEPEETQNQEIHPFYALDFIEPPLGFDNPADVAPSNLSGAWGSSDGGTYYIRHIGTTIWWLGLTRNRAPIMPPPTMQIPDPANLFKGTITVNPDGSASITGQAVVVPKGLNSGGAFTTATFTLESNRKVLHLVSTSSTFPFPSRFDKLWEP